MICCTVFTDTDFFQTAGAKSPSGSSGRRVSCKFWVFDVDQTDNLPGTCKTNHNIAVLLCFADSKHWSCTPK